MTNDNNARTKANAVFFSVLMVISMVAVGFAAAPAAAQTADDGQITFDDDQVIDTSGTVADRNVTVSINSVSPDPRDVDVVVTFDPDTTDNQVTVSNVTTATSAATGDNVEVTIDSSNNLGESGSYTAHLFNGTDTGLPASATPINPGNTLNLDNVADANRLDFDTTRVFDTQDGTRSPGVGDVYNGNTVFQGEDDLVFVDNVGSQGSISPADLQKAAGDAQGTALNLPISEDAATGTYQNDSSGTYSVNVQEPRISTAEVRLDNTDNDVSQVGPSAASALDIYAEYNFEQAEAVTVEVQDPSGTDITGEVVTDGDTLISSSGGVVNANFENEDAGEYTIIFEGNDNLDQDSVVQEYTLELTNEDTVTVDTSEDTVTQGTNLEYTVSGGTDGDLHLVTIDEGSFRSDAPSSQVFRNVADTDDIGYANSSGDIGGDSANATVAYAFVEIDGTTATGSIRTSTLDDTSVTLDVYPTGADLGDVANPNVDVDTADDASFDVEAGEITIESPDNQYTIGSEVDINGTASSADAVDIYIRNNNDWRLAYPNINVDSADEYEQEDVTLSNPSGVGSTPGADLLSQAGTYRYGVVDHSEFNAATTVGTSAFSSATSTQQSITTVEGDLNGELVTINGQINTLDNAADLTGVAEGQDAVALVYVDSRGNVAAERVDVEDDGTIDVEDNSIPNVAAQTGSGAVPLSEGTVTAHFVSQSRDNSVGDGALPGQAQNDATIGDLINFVNQNVSSRSLNADQARSLIVSETTDDTASDDLMVTQSFRYAESQTTIQSVYPEVAQADGVNPVATGETMVVAGSTNLRPNDNSITVEVLNENGDSLQIASTDEWATSGQWNVTVDTSNLEPGTYTVESDDGDNTDRAEVEIVEERQTDDGEDGQDGEDGADDGEDGADDGADDGEDGADDGEDGADDGADDGEDGADDGGDGEDGGDGGTDDSTPGFGALVALVALIAAALLATRRDN